MFGQNPDQGGGYIKLDAGIDSTDVTTIDPSLVETQFQIEIDNRLGGICDRKGKTFLSPVSVDDDDIAIYIISKNSDPNFIFTPSQTNLVSRTSPIDGPLASTVEFKVVSSVAIRSSDYLFDRLGSTATYTNAGGTDSPTQIIDSIVRVSGLTTGYSVDLPVRFAKL